MIPLQLVAFAGRHWRAIAAAAIAGGLLLALLLAKADARHWRKRYDAEAAALANEKAAHAVTRASVATLKGSIARQNADVDARAKALDEARRQAAADLAAADQRWRSTADQVAKLKAIASRPAAGCAVPKDLAEALKGL